MVVIDGPSGGTDSDDEDDPFDYSAYTDVNRASRLSSVDTSSSTDDELPEVGSMTPTAESGSEDTEPGALRRWLDRRGRNARENAERVTRGEGPFEAYVRANEDFEHYQEQHEEAETNTDRFFNAVALGVDTVTDNPYFSLQETGKGGLKQAAAAQVEGMSAEDISDEQLARASERSWEENVQAPVGRQIDRTGVEQDDELFSVNTPAGEWSPTRESATDFWVNQPVNAMTKSTTGVAWEEGSDDPLTGEEAIDFIGSVVGGGATTAGVRGASRLTSMGLRRAASQSDEGAAAAARAVDEDVAEAGFGGLLRGGVRGGSRLLDEVSGRLGRGSSRQGDEIQSNVGRTVESDADVEQVAQGPSRADDSQFLPDRVSRADPGTTGRADLDTLRVDNGGGVSSRTNFDDLPADATEARRVFDEGQQPASRFTSSRADDAAPSHANRVTDDDALRLRQDSDGTFRFNESSAGRQVDEAVPETVGPTARDALDTVRDIVNRATGRASARQADEAASAGSRVGSRGRARTDEPNRAPGRSEEPDGRARTDEPDRAPGRGDDGPAAPLRDLGPRVERVVAPVTAAVSSIQLADLFEFGDVDPMNANEMDDEVQLADGYFMQKTKPYPSPQEGGRGGAQYAVFSPEGEEIGRVVVLAVDEDGHVHVLRGSADGFGSPRPRQSQMTARELQEARERGAQAADRARQMMNQEAQ